MEVSVYLYFDKKFSLNDHNACYDRIAELKSSDDCYLNVYYLFRDDYSEKYSIRIWNRDFTMI